MIFKLMVYFKAGDTYKNFFIIIRDTDGSKEKIAIHLCHC